MLQELFARSMIEVADYVFFEQEKARAGDSATLKRFEAPATNADSSHPFAFRFPKTLRPLGDTVKPDLGLQISDLTVGREASMPRTNDDMLGQASRMTGSFALACDFLLWDYSANGPVVYGRLRVEDPITRMTPRVWENAARRATEVIVRNSPLYGPKLKERDERMKRGNHPAPFFLPPSDFTPPVKMPPRF